ncbi:MAG TPA: ATP-binding protein [Actinomycetes bacterium]|nr:ATP-binding protein [Actinomycetes bacterium]
MPSLGQLGDLIAGVARAGRTIDLVVEGDPADLPPAVDLAAYRVVQESLTNVVKHAGPAATRVRVTYHPDDVLLEVTNDPSPPTAGPGPAAATAPGTTTAPADATVPGTDTGPAAATGPGTGTGTGPGSGIAGMRKRVVAAGGELDAGPRPGGGVQVTARLPR